MAAERLRLQGGHAQQDIIRIEGLRKACGQFPRRSGCVHVRGLQHKAWVWARVCDCVLVGVRAGV